MLLGLRRRKTERQAEEPPKRSKKKKTRAVEKPPSIIEIIEHIALEDMLPRKGYFRPSMLFGCDRQNVFHYLRAPEGAQQIGPRLRRILDNGTAVHSVIQDFYLANHLEYWFVKEPRVMRVVSGVRIRGSCDGVLIRRADRYTFGIEIKSISTAQFVKLAKPKPEHIFQSRLYMELQDLEWIVIVYWDKNNQMMREYPIGRDAQAWQEVVERMAELGKYVKKKKGKKLRLPRYDKRTCDKTFCRYVDVCRKEGAPV